MIELELEQLATTFALQYVASVSVILSEDVSVLSKVSFLLHVFFYVTLALCDGTRT